ncbi:MAG: hypothetical protein Q8R13_01795 [bacterium]|nr:hypothetical protein [bacterium]MDZ4295943.1 hypothetical protein [Patescibacteria group bacterium]
MSNSNTLKYISSCPLCNRKLRPADASIIAQTAQGALVSAVCRNCSTSLLLAVMGNTTDEHPWKERSRASMVTLVGIVTDLTSSDARRFLHRKSLGVGDVLSIHQRWRRQSQRLEHV